MYACGTWQATPVTWRRVTARNDGIACDVQATPAPYTSNLACNLRAKEDKSEGSGASTSANNGSSGVRRGSKSAKRTVHQGPSQLPQASKPILQDAEMPGMGGVQVCYQLASLIQPTA